MKKILQIFFLALFVVSCSSDDDPTEEIHDVSFSVRSTDDSRQSHIEFNIMGSDKEVYHSSYSNDHLPLTRNYPAHKVKRFTLLGIQYSDNSAGAVGEAFEPYTVTLEIKVDSEIKAEKEITIAEGGQVDSVSFTF